MSAVETLRQLAVARYREGVNCERVAAEFGVGVRTVYRWVSVAGATRVKATGPRRPPKPDSERTAPSALGHAARAYGVTVAQLCAALEAAGHRKAAEAADPPTS